MLFPDVATSVLDNSFIARASTGPEIIGVVCIIAIAYEVGLIVNRIGAVFIEPVLKITKLIPFDDDYVKYNKAKKRFPILETLSREYGLSRTGIALFIILTVMALFSNSKIFAIPLVVVVVVYTVSCRKHAGKIVALIGAPTEADERASEEDNRSGA